VRPALASAVVLVMLGLGHAASAAPPNVGIQVTATDDAAPLAVTFSATGDAVTFHWDFGDGTSADGRTAAHTYAAGRWITTLTATSASGETATQTALVTSHGITLTGTARARYRRPATFRGQVIPAERGLAVTIEAPGLRRQLRARADGKFSVQLKLTRPTALTARTAIASSPALPVAIVPRLQTTLVGSGARGTRFALAARVRPVAAGGLDVRVSRGSAVVLERSFGPAVRIALGTQRLATYQIRVRVRPNEGYTAAGRLLRARVVLPRLTYGARSTSVAQLGAQLRSLHYAAPATLVFDGRMLDAVYAFQKVQGLPRTGIVDAAFWRRLNSPYAATPRYTQPASHIEVNKTRQVLFVVRGGQVALIVPVSTGGGGHYTPVGRFAIYRKVSGFDPSPLGTLYDPMYFTGGYAIHGNPSVPPYPASHGCIRVPMWLARHLSTTNPYGETVYVY
jgi:PKD repeat protein